jgi:gamma-glutamyltranspeptidase/glutathione hydrolase
VLRNEDAKRIYNPDGYIPKVGDVMTNLDLAKTFATVAREGMEVFYSGDIAKAIVETVQEDGGFITLEDLANHETSKTKPISSEYRGLEVYEHPPNGQGFAALIMLNIMEQFDFSNHDPLSSERYHLMVEAKKLAYDDLHRHNADPDYYEAPMDGLLSKKYAKSQSSLIDSSSVLDTTDIPHRQGPDTVYLCTADSDGNAVSFINSLFMGIGSGLVAKGTGIKLQNRANLFSLDPEHPNCYAPKKRPFHTIIPGALYQDRDFYGVFGIMGGDHQSQAHAQLVSNLVDYDMPPQEAMDHPRFQHNQIPNTLELERGIPSNVHDRLQGLGHKLIEESIWGFGGGQIILRLDEAWIAGSDHRKDGQAAGF